MHTTTTDRFFNGKIKVRQNRTGYRFSIDAVLLAHLTQPHMGDVILDLGTGCGIIPLILVYKNPEVHVIGVELQKELADMAVLNVIENGMQGRISILHQDLKTLKHEMINGPVDMVVSNPPFRMANSGRLNPNQERAVARQEITVTMNDIVNITCGLLRVGGRFLTIYPADRLTDILTHMRSAGIEPKFLRTIHSGCHAEAKRILVEGVKGGRPALKIGPPLILYSNAGSYTREVEEMLKP